MGIRIIIDGNDGIGKTTLAKRIGQDLGIDSYIHLSYNDPRSFGFYNEIIKKDNVVFDRSFMDEVIYSSVLERDCTLSRAQVEYLHAQLKELGVIVIIAHTKNKIYSEDEFVGIVSSERRIDTYFSDLAFKYGYIYYDTHNDNYDDLLNRVKEYLSNDYLKNVPTRGLTE